MGRTVRFHEKVTLPDGRVGTVVSAPMRTGMHAGQIGVQVKDADGKPEYVWLDEDEVGKDGEE